MSIFPKTSFKINTNHENEQVKSKLNNLLHGDKYDGFWENNKLFIKKVVTQKRIITPDINIVIVENQNNRIVLVECRLGKYFDYSIFGVFSFIAIIEFLIIRSFFINNTIEFTFIYPLILGLFIYLIIYFSFKWDVDGFRYDLNKILK